MHFIQWKTDDDTVKEDFIESFDSFFEGNLLFEFFHFLLFSGFDNFPVDPVFCAGVSPPECNKELIEKGELLLLMFLFCDG